jgi:hypothetical protein
MLPVFTKFNSTDTGLAKPISFSYFVLRNFTSGQDFFNLNNIFLGQLRFIAGFSFWLIAPIAIPRSALAGHVLRVLSVSTKKQMLWIRALRIIAGMAYEQSFGNVSKVKHPRKPRCTICIFAIYSEEKTGVPVGIKAANPFPALAQMWRMFWDWAALYYLFKKPLLYWLSSLKKFVAPNRVSWEALSRFIHSTSMFGFRYSDGLELSEYRNFNTSSQLIK